MSLYLGTDICELYRIKNLYNKYENKFLHKIFTEWEIDYALSVSNKIIERLAVRFATKEALSKALGVGLNGLGWNEGIDWKDVELLRDEKGAVFLKLYNKALDMSNNIGIKNWVVSVSHSKEYAISTVIGYK